jgi:hypothetical protein
MLTLTQRYEHLRSLCEADGVYFSPIPRSCIARSCMRARSRILEAPEPVDAVAYYVALHELGHMHSPATELAYHDYRLPMKQRLGLVVQAEVEAWDWALKASLYKRHPRLAIYAKNVYTAKYRWDYATGELRKMFSQYFGG